MKVPLQKINKLLLIFTTLISLSNCAYEFSEDSFVEVIQKNPTASISLKDISDNQTFYVPTKIHFNYNGNNKHLLYEIIIQIDNVVIKTSTTNTGDFIVDTESLDEGNHVLKVEYIFSSGSGSLADVSGVEAYIKTEEYHFTVDKSIPETVVMTSVEIIDGTIYLSWEPITKVNFDVSAIVVSNNGYIDSQALTKQELLKLKYNDKNVYAFTLAGQDPIGHDLQFYIYLENSRGSTRSNNVSLFIEPLEVEKRILNENQYKLIIPKHTLYRNFDYYVFKNPSNNSNHKISPYGGEIIVNEPIKFPSYDFNVNLDLFKVSGTSEIYKGTISSFISYNKQFQSDYGPGGYYEFIYSQLNNAVYTLRVYRSCAGCERRYTIEQRNVNDLSVINSKQIAIVEDGSEGELTIDPTTGNLILNVGNISFLVDKNSLSIIKQWSPSDFGEQSGQIIYRNNMVVIEDTDKITFYNSNTKSQFYTLDKTGYFKISASGQYFFANNSIFEITNNSVNIISTADTNYSVNLVEFIEDENKCVYNTYDGNPIVFDFMTRTKTTLSDFTRINIMDYNTGTKKLLLVRSEFGISNTQASYVYIYDFTTTNVKRIEVQNVVSIWSPDVTPSGYWFTKNKLISSYGYYLDHYLNE
ncbi:hypothetical protein [Mariniflexile sp. AS56]|uniref:hypothetical protein n=1 Tax=Mariniflexile sp. AS56 TaxID=3063957 RepID=UPI0026F17A4C|nr:hypothetical protein [Mariniflexile sp. AS56]MDO7171242.1 hypothetical protein [Mariniflexile sp. AS56]